jgi:hypothetical protein
MRSSHNNRIVISALRTIEPSLVVPVIQENICMEKLSLEAYKAVGNAPACKRIKHRIVDAKIYLLRLSGDLPS